MAEIDPQSVPLTSQQRFLLEWLSKEDASSLGECVGCALTALVDHGLAKIEHRERGAWAEVSLTAAGRRSLNQGGGDDA